MDIQALLAKMTLEEKAGLCSGLDNWHTKPVERLQIPSIMVADGPHGLRKEKDSDDGQNFVPSYPATCFPTASAMACSWDRDLLYRVGQALAEECLQEGVSVILGPGVNIKRSPLCGRNFEYFSEDPYLAAETTVQYIRGVQSLGVGTSLKHFAANNQEYRRMSINEVVDERALREIYLYAFEQAVKEAQPWTVMCAYNHLNGEYCSENKYILNDILRDEWAYSGLVMSDWGAVNDRVKGLVAGLDLEMPGGNFDNDKKIVLAVRNGDLDEKILDRCVTRILELVEAGIRNKKEGFQYDADRHHAFARQVSAESIVLLKNEDAILPLDPQHRICIIGDFARVPRYQGYGSSVMNPSRLDCAYDEMLAYMKKKENLSYARGYERTTSEIRADLVKEACLAAQQAQVVILFLGLPESHETEGIDRQDLKLPENQGHILQAVKKVNPNIVVVLSNGSPVAMPWVEDVKGIVEAYLSGQAGEGAIADILFGAVNPSGKLAETFPKSIEDTPAYQNFPGGPITVEYRESIYVGYRYYDKADRDVLFPFGYGLSYTSFAYEDLRIAKTKIKAGDTVTVSCTVCNSGKRAGKEVVQLYIGHSERDGFFPVRELKGYEKISLEAGESKKVAFTLNERSFAYYDVSKNGWRCAPGDYELSVGASSRDLRLSGMVTITAGKGEAPATFRTGLDAYQTLKDNSFDQESFQRLYGRPLPQNHEEGRAAFTLNTPLMDFKKKPLGKLVFAILRREIKKQTTGGINALHDQMIERSMLEIPLQNLTNFSNGALPQETAQALVDLANGKVLSALKALL